MMRVKKSVILLSVIVGAFAVLMAAQKDFEETNAESAVVEAQMATLGIGDKAPEIAMRDHKGIFVSYLI